MPPTNTTVSSFIIHPSTDSSDGIISQRLRDLNESVLSAHGKLSELETRLSAILPPPRPADPSACSGVGTPGPVESVISSLLGAILTSVGDLQVRIDGLRLRVEV